MQSKSEIETWWSTPDAWGYQTNSDDKLRKEIILEVLSSFGQFKKALDIGAGEGWITSDLPADKIYGIEISDNAAARFPKNVVRITEPKGKYDLIICTGMLYQHYDYRTFQGWIEDHAEDIVLTSSIKEWEMNELPKEKQIHVQEFKYRDYTQILRVFKWSL